MTFSLHGISASKGVAIGQVSVLKHSQFEVREFLIETHRIEAEVERFSAAVAAAREYVTNLRERLPEALVNQADAFLEVHLLMLTYASIADAHITLICEQRFNADWALNTERVQLVVAF